jgi:hypothetical protein
MENKIVRGKTLNYWKVNAEEDYFKVPISVLKYITILEEELKQSSITAVGCQREQLIAFMEYVQTKQAIYFIDKEELAEDYLKSN